MTVSTIAASSRTTDARQAALNQIGGHLFAMEDRIDDAYETTAQFAATLTTLRRTAGLGATVGQDVYAAAASMSGHLAAARAEVVRIHNRLEKIRRDHAVGELTILPPDGDKPPPGHFASSPGVQTA